MNKKVLLLLLCFTFLNAEEKKEAYQNNLKSREFDQEDAVNLNQAEPATKQPNLHKLGDAGGFKDTGWPTPSKTDSSGCSGIDIAKISEAFGHMIGKNIESLGVNFDIECIAQGLKDSSQGKHAPMTEEECIRALTSVQEALFKKQSAENLASAESFLHKNAKEKGVIVLHEGKLQYKIEKKGKGAEVQPHFTPFVRYVGKYLNGSVFGASQEGEPLSLDETIPGIQEGLVGMKEGEKRTLFIHPNLAYGTSGFLPPNSLLTFEVELIRANAEEMEKNLIPKAVEKKEPPELALPFEKREAVR